nr:hypothetical protein [Tanacetum cinerariifolium]
RAISEDEYKLKLDIVSNSCCTPTALLLWLRSSMTGSQIVEGVVKTIYSITRYFPQSSLV